MGRRILLLFLLIAVSIRLSSQASIISRDSEQFDNVEDEEAGYNSFENKDDSLEADDEEQYSRQDFAEEDQFDDDIEDREPENNDGDEEDDLRDFKNGEAMEKELYSQEDSFQDESNMMEDNDDEEQYSRQEFAEEDQFDDDIQDRESENDDSYEEEEQRDFDDGDPYDRQDFDEEEQFAKGVRDYDDDEGEDLEEDDDFHDIAAEDGNGLLQERKNLDEEIGALQTATGEIKNRINTLRALFDSLEAAGRSDDSEEAAQVSKQQRQYDFAFSLVK